MVYNTGHRGQLIATFYNCHLQRLMNAIKFWMELEFRTAMAMEQLMSTVMTWLRIASHRRKSKFLGQFSTTTNFGSFSYKGTSLEGGKLEIFCPKWRTFVRNCWPSFVCAKSVSVLWSSSKMLSHGASWSGGVPSTQRSTIQILARVYWKLFVFF